MAHTHPVVDSDSRFVINSDTRAITTASDKLELIQGDHQSERITFEIPRVVEGHDMSLCDRIEIHYINIDRKTKAQSKDIYIADDVTLDAEKVVFSWLISGNATKYYGRLNFIVLFECLDDNGNYTYKWNTEICKLLTVGEGISNTEAVAEDYSDILEKFRLEVVGEATKDAVKFTEQELTDEQKTQARKNIDAVSKNDIVQSDWNQNNETKSDYIKNRICYEEEVPEEIIAEWRTYGSYYAEVTLSKPLIVGKTYNTYSDSIMEQKTAVLNADGSIALSMVGRIEFVGGGAVTQPSDYPEQPAFWNGPPNAGSVLKIAIPASTNITKIPNKFIDYDGASVASIDALQTLSESGLITPAQQDGTFYTSPSGEIYVL